MIDGLHFLRPDALWALLALPIIIWLLYRRQQDRGSWRQAIDPELLPWLLPSQHQATREDRTLVWLPLLFGMAMIAAAGPSFQRADVPVFQRADALVIVLDLSDSMRARDIQPSRAQRARQKISDVLATREEGVTGLVAYAGDAHVVTPLTDDRGTIENLLPALTPDIMPIPGSDATAALSEAIALITAAGMANGRILLLTDGMPRFAADPIAEELDIANIDIDILGIGTAQGAPMPLPGGGFIRDDAGEIVVPVLDASRLAQIADTLGGRFTTVSLDDADIRLLTTPSSAGSDNNVSLERRTDTWVDQGHWLALLVALGLLPLFRRGMVPALLLAVMLPVPESRADSLWESLWQTPDQRGTAALADGDAAAAAEIFKSPAWRGTAAFKAGEYAEAAADFDQLDSADSHYNRGNALAMQGNYDAALAAFEQSLAINPERTDAQANRDLMEKLIQQQEQQQEQENDSANDDDDANREQDGEQQPGENSESDQQQQQNGGDPSDQDDQSQRQPDSNDSDQRSDQSEKMQQQMDEQLEDQTAQQMQKFDKALEEQQKLEQWMRRVPDEPGGLLRNKFRYQAIQRLRNGERPDEEIRW